MGRLSTKWDALSEYNKSYSGSPERTGWTRRAVGLCWSFGLELWSVRNGLIYGTGGTPSKTEVTRLKELATTLYQHRFDMEGTIPTRAFPPSFTTVESMSPELLKAWVGQIQYLYPEKYDKLLSDLKAECRT